MFQAPWKDYSLGEMDRVELDGEELYVPHDCTCVFIKGREGESGARRASAAEIAHLWEKYRPMPLLKVLRMI